MSGPDDVSLEWLGWVGQDRPRRVPGSSDVPTFLRFLERLSTSGEGYAEVNRVLQAFPMLALSAASGHAVVHQFRSQDECYLLRGDGCVPADGVLEVPIIEGRGSFSGGFVVPLHTAVGALEAFARSAPAEQLGEWVLL